MISRKEAFILLKKYLRDEQNIIYSISVEAILREIAKKIERDENLWGLTGLLHNLDYEFTENNPEQRGTLSSQLLEDLLPERGVNAIRANNYIHTDYMPTTSLDKVLIAAVATTGLIFEIVHSLPTKKIDLITIDILKAKFVDSSFAPRYNRNKIKLCTDFGLDLPTFLELSLNALKGISSKIIV